MTSTNKPCSYGMPVVIYAIALMILCCGGGTLYARDVPKYGIFEHTITKAGKQIANVWEDVTIDVAIKAPSGKTFKVGGFYHSANTWKFRFSPNETGTWRYSYKASGAFTKTGKGSFTCKSSSSPGFIKVSPDNPRRWVYDNGKPYHPFGHQDYFGNRVRTTWRMGGKDNLTWSKYLDKLDKMGFNLWRVSHNNCSPAMYKKLDPAGNVYHEKNGRQFDSDIADIRARGYSIILVPFLKIPFSREDTSVDKMKALKRYLQYAMNRWGAYTDIWEIANEMVTNPALGGAYYKDSVATMLSKHIKMIDPYKPTYVSISFERTNLEGIDVISPHTYVTAPPEEFIKKWNWQLGQWYGKNQPIIWGEAGNRNPGRSQSDKDDLRWRVISWFLFFSEGTPVFWHQGGPDFRSSSATNLYYSPGLQESFRHLTIYMKGFDGKAVKGKITSGDVTAYTLSGPKHYGLYIWDVSGYSRVRSGLQLEIDPKGGGSGKWCSTATGRVLGVVNIPKGGKRTIKVPDFKEDIALKIRLTGK